MARPTIPCVPLEGAACHLRLWRQRGRLHAAVVVKATLSLLPRGPMGLAAPEPVLEEAEHHGGSPAKSLKRATELIPWRRRVDVTANGWVATAGGEPLPATTVRLAVYRGQTALLDKTIYAYGDRTIGADGKPTAPEPFTRLPLVYERALRTDANPTGVSPDDGVPNLYDPRRRDQAAGYGPISRYARTRRRLLGSAERKAVEGEVAELPDAFDGDYFQAAPTDQQIAQLQGDEWLIMDGFDADHRRIASQLPQIRAEALVMAVDDASAQAIAVDAPLRYRPLRLAIDGLHLDAEVGRVSVCWRGSLAILDETALAGLRILGGVAAGPQTLAWPHPESLVGPAPPSEPRQAPAAPEVATDLTASLDGASPGRAMPFRVSVDAPWGDPSIRPIPQAIGSGEVALADRRGATITLSAEERARLRQALPFSAPDVEGTRTLSEEEAAAAASRAEAPFAVARPGEGRPAEAPEGAPFASGPARQVPRPRVGDATMDVGGAGDADATSAVPPGVSVEAARFFHRRRAAGDAPSVAEDAPTTGPPTVPPRTTEAIPIERQTSLHLAYLPWQHRPPHDSLTIVVKGSFDLRPGQAAALREECDYPTGDLTWDDEEGRSLRYASDLAYFKPRADVMLVGHAYAPWEDEGRRRRAGTATQVRFRFGRGEEGFDRRIAVFGERRWEKAFLALAPTEPLPFEKMPLVYERAFGGADWGPNPVGVGRGAAAGPGGVARLPNLEDPADLIDSPGDVPRPACLGPVHPLWGARFRGLGTYDSRWLSERWPYFPDDFDWSHYQAAPPEQRLETVDPDAPFVITGAHPEHTHVEGRLPGIMPRCFMALRGEDVGAPGAEVAFEEIGLRLDTVFFDLDAMRLDLVWRGVIEVSDEHAPEIQALFLLHDEPGQQTSLDEAYARLVGAMAPTEPIAEAPEGEVTPANEVAKEPSEDDPLALELAQLDERIAAQVERQQEELAAAGIDPSPPPEPPSLDPEHLASSLRAAGTSEEEIAQVMAALELSAPSDEEVVSTRTPREEVVARLAAGESLAGLTLRDADLSDLDMGGVSLVEADLRGAKLQRAKLSGADLSRALLSGADLSDADLSGAKLVEALADEAILTGARLDDADLEALDLTGAHGPEASFRRARGPGLRLTEGSWEGARFDEAALPQAHLDGSSFSAACFDGADLTEALLFDAVGEGATFRGACIVDALGDGVDLSGAQFHRALATGTVWEGARLREASFLEAKLDDSSFVRADLERADLSAAELRDVRMKRVAARGARFVKSNLLRAQLERSDLRDADFTGASLYGCEVWKSDTGGAVFLDALVAMSKLEGRR